MTVDHERETAEIGIQKEGYNLLPIKLRNCYPTLLDPLIRFKRDYQHIKEIENENASAEK